MGSVSGGAQAESLMVSGATYSQNFDTLVNTTGNTGSTPADTPGTWTFVETSTNANTFYTAGNGNSNAGDTYSYGTDNVSPTNSNRAIGMLRSANLASTIGASFTNDIANSIITSLAIEYAGEQWRLGVARTPGTLDRIDFQYSLNATALNDGTWTDVNALDFSTTTTLTVVGQKDGNQSTNRAIRASTITGLNIAPGATFWIRWTDFDVSGVDDGLAVDDFFLTPTAEPVPVPIPLAAVGGLALFPFVIIGQARRRRNRE